MQRRYIFAGLMLALLAGVIFYLRTGQREQIDFEQVEPIPGYKMEMREAPLRVAMISVLNHARTEGYQSQMGGYSGDRCCSCTAAATPRSISCWPREMRMWRSSQAVPIWCMGKRRMYVSWRCRSEEGRTTISRIIGHGWTGDGTYIHERDAPTPA